MAIPDHASKQSYESDNDDDAFMKCVAPSEIATEDAQPGGVYMGGETNTALQQIQHQHPQQNSNDGARDPSINLQMTVDVRKLLNRKPESRPKPLLKLVCRGCGLSTHDADPFLPNDYVEFLDNDM